MTAHLSVSAGNAALTVMLASSRVALTKTRRQLDDGQIVVTDYPDVARFSAFTVPIGTIDDTAEVVKVMSGVPNACIVRGTLTAHAVARLKAGRAIPRRMNPASGEPMIADTASPMIIVDADDAVLREVDDLVDAPELAVEHFIASRLPAAFHNVRCYWQLSASCGFTPGLMKLHIFLHGDRAVESATLRYLMHPYADTAPYSGNQICYIAPPILIGMHDPLPRRQGWLDGEHDTVDVSAIPPPPTREYLIPSFGGQSSGDHPADLMRTVAMIGDGLAGFHAPLRDTIWSYRRAVAHGQLRRDDPSLIRLLRDRITAAPRTPHRDVSRYLSDAYLAPSISAAFAKPVTPSASSVPTGVLWD